MFQNYQKGKEKSRAAGDLDNRKTEFTSWKCFRCGSQYYLIAKFPKVSKEIGKRQNKLHFIVKGNRACNIAENNSNQKIYS